MIRNQRGEGLISVLVSVAILGLIIVTMVTLYQLFGTMMTKSLLRREADMLNARIRGMIMEKSMCERAFVNQSWNGQATVDVVIRDGALVYQRGYTFANGRLQIGDLLLRKKYVENPISPQTATNNPGPVRLGATAYESYVGEIVVRIVPVADVTNTGLISDRTVPVLLVVDPANGFRIISCDINDESTISYDCDQIKAAAAGNDCGPPIHAGCENMYYVNGVDFRGEPVCNCKQLCPVPIWRGQAFTGSCSITNTIDPPAQECPFEAKVTAGPRKCYGWEGVTCFWKEAQGTDGCPALRYPVHRSECKINFP